MIPKLLRAFRRSALALYRRSYPGQTVRVRLASGFVEAKQWSR